MHTPGRHLVFAAVAVLVAAASFVKADDKKTIAHYTAQAVDITAPAGRATGLIDIQITRWSTDAERDQLMTAIWEKGTDDALNILRKMPSVGVFRSPDTAGYDLRYARQQTVNGDTQIVVATDRPIAFWEAATIAESTKYPFTVIELHVHPDGKGEGKMSVAARIDTNKATKTLTLENYTLAPVQLQNVRKEK